MGKIVDQLFGAAAGTVTYLVCVDSVIEEGIHRPGLHLRPAHADHARPPLQWTLHSVFSVCGNDNSKLRPPPDRGILKIVSRLLIA